MPAWPLILKVFSARSSPWWIRLASRDRPPPRSIRSAVFGLVDQSQRIEPPISIVVLTLHVTLLISRISNLSLRERSRAIERMREMDVIIRKELTDRAPDVSCH